MTSYTMFLSRWSFHGRMRAVALPLLLTMAVPMTACAPPVEGEITAPEGGELSSEPIAGEGEMSSQGLTGAEVLALYEAGKKAYGYYKQAREAYDWIRNMYTPPRDPLVEIDMLREELRRFEAAVAAMARDFDYRLTAVETKALHDNVESWRRQSSAALDYARQGSDTISMAFGAASALENESFYFYTPKAAGQPRRFDSRVTVLSFIESVNTWMAIRGVKKLRNDDFTRQQLQRFAGRLDFVANNILSRVSCFDQVATYQYKERAKPGSPYYITHTNCRADKFCHDQIEGISYERTPGYPRNINVSGERACYASEIHNWTVPSKVQQVASDRYFLNLVQENAATWRDLARF